VSPQTIGSAGDFAAEASAPDRAIMALIDRQYLARPYHRSRRMAAWLATACAEFSPSGRGEAVTRAMVVRGRKLRSSASDFSFSTRSSMLRAR
jgi:hypothetical protein